MKTRFPIVKPVLPKLNNYLKYVEGVFDRNWLTNNGPLVQELESRLAEYLQVRNLMLVSNGTLALHLAYKALDLTGQVITTPFSFAATASSLCWEKLTPNFVDIEQGTFNLDHRLLESHKSAEAIVAVHVFGNPCRVEAIEEFAQRNNQTVIYDAAHAFGVQYKNRSLLSFGDASTLSLHATKLFHCVEGGAVIFKDKEKLQLAKQKINFGFDSNNIPVTLGINAKMSEMHAAMGLTMLDMVDDILSHRQALVAEYFSLLNNIVEFQIWQEQSANNGAYMPVLFESESQLLKVVDSLMQQGIQTRRYFYPCLSELPVYGLRGDTPVSEGISRRILCLPLYFDLSLSDVALICHAVKIAMIK